jgi:hypothetical protein
VATHFPWIPPHILSYNNWMIPQTLSFQKHRWAPLVKPLERFSHAHDDQSDAVAMTVDE